MRRRLRLPPLRRQDPPGPPHPPRPPPVGRPESGPAVAPQSRSRLVRASGARKVSVTVAGIRRIRPAGPHRPRLRRSGSRARRIPAVGRSTHALSTHWVSQTARVWAALPLPVASARARLHTNPPPAAAAARQAAPSVRATRLRPARLAATANVRTQESLNAAGLRGSQPECAP